ncbi:MAG TPA: ABC transporter permease [Anaeromyxobacter sp.]|nr:ABC transporter permease [Anaeromyxobacter sp.]
MEERDVVRGRGAASRILPYIGERWSGFFLIFLLVIFSLVGRNFFAVRNFSNILYFATIYLLLAAGETFVIITGGIDLSVGFVMGLVTVVSAIVMRDLHAAGAPPAVSMISGSVVGLVVGIFPGLINGYLVARLRVPPFIATLGMYGVANGLMLNLCQGFPIYYLPPQAQQIGNLFVAYFLPGRGFTFFQRPPGMTPDDIRNLVGIVPVTVLVAAVVLLVFGFVLVRTRFGRHTFAIGGNLDAALRAGIAVPRHLVKVYVLSSMMAAVAGVLYTFRAGIGHFTTLSSSYELFAIAAVVIGGASLMGGRGSVGGTVIGVLILNVLENGLNITGLPAFYRYMATGLILIAAVVIDQLTPERRPAGD